MTTDRFYGGVSDWLQNLRSMLAYIRDEHPSRNELTEWVVANTRANSKDAVSHHLTFLDAIEIVELSNTRCAFGDYDQQWLGDQNAETLYDALSSGVKGFDTTLEALREGPMTDEDIMDLLVSEFDDNN
jgi:putative restriction endonuclease